MASQPVLAIPQVAPKVGIIGGGIGGLYAAYLLQRHGIPYEILEASPRLGGRLFTYRMGDRPNDYYVSLRRASSIIKAIHTFTRMSGQCASLRHR